MADLQKLLMQRQNFFLIFLTLIFLSQTGFTQDLADWQTITNMNTVNDIFVADEYAWAATTGGMLRIDLQTDRIRQFNNVDGLQAIKLTVIEGDGYGTIITAGEQGIIEFFDSPNGQWSQDYNLQNKSITDILFQNDTLWVSTNEGLAVYLRGQKGYFFFDYFKNFDVLPTEINDIALFNKRVWMATNQGLYTAPSNLQDYTINDPEQWAIYSSANQLNTDKVLALGAIGSELWVGTDIGMAVVNPDLDITLLTDWGIGNEFIVQAIESINDELFAVTNLEDKPYSIYRYDHEGTKTLVKRFNDPINSIAEDQDGSLWVGVDGNGIYRDDKHFKMDGPVTNNVRYIYRDSQERIWASSGKYKSALNDGFSINDGQMWTSFDFIGSGWTRYENSTMFYEDRFNNVWIGTWGGGLIVYRDDAFRFFHNYQNDGKMIIETADTTRVVALEPIPESYRGFFSGVVTATSFEVVPIIKEGPQGHLWITNYYASNDNILAVAPYAEDGFISLDQEQWQYFTSSDGLIAEEGAISAIEFDDFGRAWIGTLKNGIYLLDFNQTVANKTDDQLFHLQIQDNLWSNSILSLALDSDGVVWIGTAAGLNSFDGVNIYRHIKQINDDDNSSGPIENQINQIRVDTYNNKWFATTGGVSILPGDKSPWDTLAWKAFHPENSGLVDDEVHSLFIDNQNRQVLIGTENGLSIYTGSFAEIEADFNNVNGGPNPFIITNEQDRFVLTHLQYNSTVKIYNLNARLIRTLNAQGAYVEGSRAFWDGTDKNGHTVATGIYLYMAYANDGTVASGKIAVIRK
ncbi:MAG: hypothetical protein GF313_04410 [Caldithrix sp.]|nr:hypothetical protein [Caldithrix sp.]